ncbi:MAG: hypothetical protein ACMXYF_00085 [Candidatus Woesearchaeota archaeon]
MIKSDDFYMLGAPRNGTRIVYEKCAGLALVLEGSPYFWMFSKTGQAHSFIFPAGRIKICNNFPETDLEAALRETHEEFFIENNPTKFSLNSFQDAVREEAHFSDETSYKTTQYFGAFAKPERKNLILPNTRLARAISFTESKTFAQPKLQPLITKYLTFLQERHE